MKRVLLFVLTNLAIILVLGIVLNLLGFSGTLDSQGQLDLNALLLLSTVFGFGGAFISLWLSKWMAKRATGAQVIDQPRNEVEQWLVSTVARQAEQAGIGMPEVAIYESDEANAFATGASRNNALVAVSTGLVHSMDQDEVEAVLGHEVSHIANGDMVTLTLIQGVLNTFVIFFSRIIGHLVDRVILKNEHGYGIGYFVTSILAQIVLGILASIIVCWFSRQREFRADQGGAALSSRGSMANALRRLQTNSQQSQSLPKEMAAFGIFGDKSSGFMRLFMSHPPLEERIKILESRY